MIKDAQAVPGANFKILSSPWSPPAWMKTNGQMNYGGQPKEETAELDQFNTTVFVKGESYTTGINVGFKQ